MKSVSIRTRTIAGPHAQAEAHLLRPVLSWGPGMLAAVLPVGAVVLIGLYAYLLQLRDGLSVTGMRDTVSWGLYITNFVFFIGISHVGALLSSILRLTGAGWRHPITRMAEAITFSALLFGALMPIVDLGRPERALNLLVHGRIQSPILWDMISITTYLAGSTLFLYLPMIPDLALLRDQAHPLPGWRRWIYRALSIGWTGSATQHARLERAMGLMAVLILPIAVMVHTVVSWIFAMTLRAGWNSTIFGPYFVAGALASGAASVVIAMAVFRRIYRLERWITVEHFRKMAALVLVLDLVYLYFNLSEYATTAYKMELSEKALLMGLFSGPMAPLFWFTQVFGLILPGVMLVLPSMLPAMRRRQIPLSVAASAMIVLQAWLKRFLIVVPVLEHPFLPVHDLASVVAIYRPTWVEWSITAAAIAGFVLVYYLFSRFFPIVSVWETVGAEHAAAPEGRAVRPRFGPAQEVAP